MKIHESLDLKGRTALITGGSEGIGKAIAMGLAEAGATVVINYFSEDEKAIETKQEIERTGNLCLLFKCDISQDDAVEKCLQFLSEHQQTIDILILNASVQFRKDWNEVTSEEFELQVNTNLRSTLLFVQALNPAMKAKGWGRILTIGSVQQVRPHPQMIVYAATKSAQVNMVKNLAVQLAKDGVTINNLAPGAIATRRNAQALEDEEYKKLVESKIPVGVIGEPFDCAPLALLLCSEAGKYITGQDIMVDGGMSLNS